MASQIQTILSVYPDLPISQIIDGRNLPERSDFHYDVAVIGSGTGGMTAAWVLARSGLKVLILEEGGLLNHGEFPQTEFDAYASMYRGHGLYTSHGHGVRIFQGCSVGGGSSVSWTACARTPMDVLRFWREQLGMGELSVSEMDRWFTQIESQLNIEAWTRGHNPNNEVLRRGAAQLGLETFPVLRHVQDCRQLGRCGLSCTVGANRSVFAAMLPEILQEHAHLLIHVKAWHLQLFRGQVESIRAVVLDEFSHPTGQTVRIFARHVVVAGGAIQTPALLLRSGFPDPYRKLGRHVFLQPACFSVAKMPEQIHSWEGVPQSAVFVPEHEVAEGFSVHAFPLHPLFAALHFPGHGREHTKMMQELPYLNCLATTLRDGFLNKRLGGRVKIAADGTPSFSYLLRPSMWRKMQEVWALMAQIQFAAGAERVMPLHESARWYDEFASLKADISLFPRDASASHLSSWSVVGGAAMSAFANNGVVSSLGRHWQIPNVTICDASMLPTSLSAPPILTIAALALRAATHLAFTLHEQT